MGSYKEKEVIPLKRGEPFLFKWGLREKEPGYLRDDTNQEKNKRKNTRKKCLKLLAYSVSLWLLLIL